MRLRAQQYSQNTGRLQMLLKSKRNQILLLASLLAVGSIFGISRLITSSKTESASTVESVSALPIPADPASLNPEVRAVLIVVGVEPGDVADAIDYIDSNWQPELTPMLIDALTLTSNAQHLQALLVLLQVRTGQNHSYDIHAWYEWLWNQPALEHPQYGSFKSILFSYLDPKFSAYFNDQQTRNIRLDEVRWGGVKQDGIPPLRGPKMLAATEADYLDDSNIVFGIAVNGDVRAYPKRILAWHEMFVDTVGGVPVTGVYCTLCGTMILYKSEINGVEHQFGTSGFLYRSNKLMYDQATQSLWVTLLGQPAIGPLAEQDLALEHLSVVTTTWGEWRRRHPETQVLSLDTGHSRDYGEGIAYQDYFATDDLMFNVPNLDERLANKDEVLGLLFPEQSEQPLAISADFLINNPVYHDRIGKLDFVVLTDPSGANRVYDNKGLQFSQYDGAETAVDDQGRTWQLTEDALVGSDGETLNRLPAFRAFWFGWYSAYAQSRLVQ